MKKKMQQAPTTFTTDAHGQRLAHVALANTSQRATLYAEDLERLIAAGWSPYWSLTNTGARFLYVLTGAANPRGRKRSVTVARLIAQPAKGFRVQYIDGDRCNLRRDNLRTAKGGGHAPTPAAALHPRRAEFIADKPAKDEAAKGCREAPQRVPVAREECHSTATEAPGNTTVAGHHAKAENPSTCQLTDAAPVVSPAVFAPRTVDRGALSARVRERIGHVGP